MQVEFNTVPWEPSVLVVPVYEKSIGAQSKAVDRETLNGVIADTLERSDRFGGKAGETYSILPPKESGWKEIILAGMGKPEELNEKAIKKIAASLYKTVDKKSRPGMIVETVEGFKGKDTELAAQLADAVLEQSYEYDALKSKKAEKLGRIEYLVSDPKEAKEIFDRLQVITESNFWARDLGNTPANLLNPETYEEEIRKELEPLGVKITTIEADELERMGAGGIIAVGQGSKTPPRMVIMEYDGTNGQQDRPYGLVGKGITFDSGGYSIKSSGGMPDMIMDMCGSAAVAGAVRALAARGAKAKVVAIIGLAENMVDKNAYRPGDSIKMLSGKSVDVLNTDAEGRLVLADCITHIQNEYNPVMLVDAATLTGAVVAALGHEFAGIFSHDDTLVSQFQIAANETGEQVWRLPLSETFTKAMQGKRSDLSNMSNIKVGGASTAASFLNEFVEKDPQGKEKTRWLHLDLAGTAIPANGIANGWGVRLLERLITNMAEPQAVGQSFFGPKPGNPAP